MRTALLIAAAALSLVGACTSPLSRDGPLPPAAARLKDATYTFAPAPGDADGSVTQASELVREALAGIGYRESPNGRYRLEIGLASAPLHVEVQRPENSAESVKGMTHPIVLCRPQRYVLTVGMIDRTNGSLLFRNAAAARHCGGSPAKILAKLVRTAVNG
ncbi:MAG: hypothetical protein JF608_03925 [Sphingomonadales bacterium]|jgi:hypothetical protein|nr:hypothetical protein [Sphingomonadales bacterium]